MSKNKLIPHISVCPMFASLAKRYDFANFVLSGGIHLYWRTRLLSLLDKELSRREFKSALDLCTGTGDLLPALEKRIPKVMGLDFCGPMLKEAQYKGRVIRTGLIQADALKLPLKDNSFDLICVAYGVRNFPNLHQGLCEIRRVMKEGGQLFILEFGMPSHIIVRTAYASYARWWLPLIGGLLTGNKNAYSYLAKTVQTFPCKEDFCDEVRQAGLTTLMWKSLSGGIAYIYQARKE